MNSPGKKQANILNLYYIKWLFKATLTIFQSVLLMEDTRLH